MPLRVLHHDVLIQIIEASEVKTIKEMIKIPYLQDLINSYKKSIISNKHKNFVLPAGSCWSSPLLLTWDYGFADRQQDPLDPITMEPVAQVIPVNEWESIEEVKCREREVKILLNAPYLRLNPGPGASAFTWPKLACPVMREKLRAILKRALYQCDRLRDMEALAVAENELPARAYDYFPDISNLPSNLAQSLINSGLDTDLQRYISSESVPLAARRLQRRQLRRLHLNELAEMFILCRIAVESWHASKMLPPYRIGDESNDNFPREKAFQETLLRYGSYFLYSEARGFGARAKHKREMFEKTESHLFQYGTEDGPFKNDHPLFDRLKDELKDRLKVGDRNHLEAAIFAHVEELIGAKAGTVFENPPSARGYGAAEIPLEDD